MKTKIISTLNLMIIMFVFAICRLFAEEESRDFLYHTTVAADIIITNINGYACLVENVIGLENKTFNKEIRNIIESKSLVRTNVMMLGVFFVETNHFYECKVYCSPTNSSGRLQSGICLKYYRNLELPYVLKYIRILPENPAIQADIMINKYLPFVVDSDIQGISTDELISIFDKLPLELPILDIKVSTDGVKIRTYSRSIPTAGVGFFYHFKKQNNQWVIVGKNKWRS